MDTTFELKTFDKIIAIRSKNSLVGFHTEKLEVASLAEDIWTKEPEALSAVQSWSNELSQAPARQKSIIRSITINVTQVCNLHCTYCAAGGDGTFGDPVKRISIEKTLPQIHFFLDKVPEGGSFRITFLGGEPLLYPEAIEMISDYAIEQSIGKNIQIKFVIVTNGTLFNDKILAILKKTKADITISLDGDPEINDRNRPTKGGQGTTQKVISGLRLLLEHKTDLGRIGLSGVFGAMNPDVERAYNFYSEFPVDWFDFTYDHVESSPDVSQKFMLALEKTAEKAFHRGGEKELRKVKLFDTYFEMLDSQTKTENFCGAGKSYLIIDARNNMYTCPWTVGDSKEVVGVGTDLWQDKLAPYQEPLIEKNNCQSCWARYLCGGGCMFMHKNQTGSKNLVDKNFCERTRYLIAVSILYYEKSRLRKVAL